MDIAARVLESVRNKGVRLWLQGGQLRYHAPKGALTAAQMDKLRESRSKIVTLLERDPNRAGEDSAALLGQELRRAPVAFSQWAHWNLYGLGKRPAIRTVTSATRLKGRLHVAALEESIRQMIRRHPTLRTRIIAHEGMLMQQISESGECNLEIIDLAVFPAPVREAEVIRQIEHLILEPVDVARGPLFVSRLLQLQADEHILLLAMEHTISDGYSLNILARDLFATYVQAVRGQPLSLPRIEMQFADYAVQQRSAHASWLKRHGPYWSEHLAGCQRVRFPRDRKPRSDTNAGRGSVSLRIDRELKVELREWCRVRRTTLVMSLFTAYVATVLRWCDVSDGLFQYQTNARFSSGIEDTLGYVATVLYLRLSLRDGDCFEDLLERTTLEYCNAHEHADFSYMAAQRPAPEFIRNTSFNWTPQGSSQVDLSELDASEDALACSRVPFAFPAPADFELDREPFILLADADDEVVADIYFSLNHFSVELMERFAQTLLLFIKALPGHPGQGIVGQLKVPVPAK
jgi:hypothetical protein